MEHNIATKGEVFELSITDKFTFADNKVFSNILEHMLASGLKKFAIDLAGVEFIDSAALGMLLLARDKCEKGSISLTLRNPKGQIKQMFDISRFHEIFKIESSAE